MSSLSDTPDTVQQLETQQDAVIDELDQLNDQILALLDSFSPKEAEERTTSHGDLSIFKQPSDAVGSSDQSAPRAA